MAEYIEREVACAVMPDDYYGWRDKQILNFIPAADVVARDCYDRLLAENDEMRKERPVVRCKDCIYISEHAFVETDEAYCSEHDWCVSETYFCADGKKGW